MKKVRPFRPKKILVFVGEDLLGDALLKLPFLTTLKNLYPHAEIYWWTGHGPTAFRTLLKEMADPLITSIWEKTACSIRWRDLFRESPYQGYFFDLILDTQRDFLTTFFLKKIPHAFFISPTACYLLSDARPNSSLRPQSAHLKDQLLFLLELFCGQRLGCHQSPAVPSFYQDAVQSFFKKGKRYVGLSPGAGQRWKCWPLERFIAVAQDLILRSIIPVFFLGPNEQDQYKVLKPLVPEALFPLQENKEWLKSPLYTAALGMFCVVNVANDSGTGHLLALGGRPLISLFGKTKSEKISPAAQTLVILKAKDYGKDKCLNQIPIEAVLERLNVFL